MLPWTMLHPYPAGKIEQLVGSWQTRWGIRRGRYFLRAIMTHPSRLTPTANSPISTPFCKAVAVSSLVNLVMKFLALLADCVCMAAQIALATRVASADGAADGLLIIPSRTLLLVFCWRGSVCQCCCRFYRIRSLLLNSLKEEKPKA